MLIPEKSIIDFVKLKIGTKNDKDNEIENKVSAHDTWITLLSRAHDFAPPVFTKSGCLGNNLLDTALLKASETTSCQSGYPLDFVRKTMCIALKNNVLCRRDAASTIRFLRDFDIGDITFCPECEEENELEWTKCTKCGFDRTQE